MRNLWNILNKKFAAAVITIILLQFSFLFFLKFSYLENLEQKVEYANKQIEKIISKRDDLYLSNQVSEKIEKYSTAMEKLKVIRKGREQSFIYSDNGNFEFFPDFSNRIFPELAQVMHKQVVIEAITINDKAELIIPIHAPSYYVLASQYSILKKHFQDNEEPLLSDLQINNFSEQEIEIFEREDDGNLKKIKTKVFKANIIANLNPALYPELEDFESFDNNFSFSKLSEDGKSAISSISKKISNIYKNFMLSSEELEAKKKELYDLDELIKKLQTQDTVSSIEEKSENIFTDISNKHPNAKAISYLKERNIIGGLADGSFQPDKSVSRVEALKMLILGLDKTDSLESPMNFSDTSNDQWYAQHVKKGLNLNMVKGYANNTFKPANTVNKAEFFKILIEGSGLEVKNYDSSSFADVSTDAWFSPYLEFALENNIIDKSRNFEPAREISRAEVAESLYRMIMLISADNQSESSTKITTEEVITTSENTKITEENLKEVSPENKDEEEKNIVDKKAELLTTIFPEFSVRGVRYSRVPNKMSEFLAAGKKIKAGEIIIDPEKEYSTQELQVLGEQMMEYLIANMESKIISFHKKDFDPNTFEGDTIDLLELNKE